MIAAWRRLITAVESVAITAAACFVAFIALVYTNENIDRKDDEAQDDASNADVSRQTNPLFGVGCAATIIIHWKQQNKYQIN